MKDVKTQHLDSLVSALKDLLGKWADRDGVDVKYHRVQPLLMFSLKTEDGLAIKVTYDINKTSKEYIDNMIAGIRDQVMTERQERHSKPIIINTGRAANA